MRGTAQIGEGDLRHRILVETDDEFGKLSRAFNSMVTDLEVWSDKLAVSEKKYRLLTENVNDVIFSLDARGRILYCNPQAEHITGYTIEELDRRYVTSLISRESRRFIRSVASELERADGLEVEIVKKDCTIVSLEAKLVKSEGGDDNTYYYGVARDITERKKVESQIHSYQKELRSLASQLILAEAEEKKKIASLIHDRVGQALSITRIKLGILNSIAPPGEEATIVGELIPLIEEIIQDTRSLIFTISSPLLYDLGLSAALERLVEQFNGEHRMDFAFDGPEKTPDIDTDVALLLFDAVKELLVNVVKHSQAHSVMVTLNIRSQGVQISVTDDGKGFEVLTGTNGRKRGSGFGLFSIRERLDNLGGSCQVISGTTGGSEIVLNAPMGKRETD